MRCHFRYTKLLIVYGISYPMQESTQPSNSTGLCSTEYYNKRIMYNISLYFFFLWRVVFGLQLTDYLIIHKFYSSIIFIGGVLLHDDIC